MKARVAWVAFVALAGLAVTPRPAAADATAFLGFTTSPTNRSARGFSLGFTVLSVAGLEFEYASTTEDPSSGSPLLRMGSANAFVQTPIAVARMHFYATAGAELYREVLGSAGVTNVGVNAGGGVKVNLFGPLRLRVDYRVYRLSGSARYPTPQRLYVGLNLKF